MSGAKGSLVLLVHGFPETWWTFHELIPLLSERHRVLAVDLRGFGESVPAQPGHDDATAAADLAALIDHLHAGPVHLAGQDIDELAGSYARGGGFAGAAGLYRSVLGEAQDIRALAARRLDLPVLAIGGGSGDFTPATMRQVASDVTAVTLEGIGHYVAMEAPDRLAETLIPYYREVDGRS